jgi:hypothetical protein
MSVLLAAALAAAAASPFPPAHLEHVAPAAIRSVPPEAAAHQAAEADAHDEEEPSAKLAHKRRKAPKRKRAHAKATPAGQPVPFHGGSDGPTLDTDPGVAVGKDDFVIAYTGDKLQFRNRNGDLLAKKNGGSVQPSFKAVFLPLLPFLNKEIVQKRFKLQCDPDHPAKSQINCINEVYDGRVYYDTQRNRFWLIANSRANKAPSNGPVRFPLVAVSVSQDPRDGWFLYTTFQQKSDWPKITVFEDYVMIGHAKSPNIWIYDANLLAQGKNSPLIWRFTGDDFDTDYVTVVRQHAPSAHMAIVLGADFGDDDISVFGLLNPTPGKAGKPKFIDGGSVDLDVDVKLIDQFPVFRNGKIFMTWMEQGDLGNQQIRVIRMPVMKNVDKAELSPSSDVDDGYREWLLAADPVGQMYGPRDAKIDIIDYVKPSLDVIPHGDAVIVFAAGGVKTVKPLDWEIRYTVLYRDEKQPRPVGILRTGECGGLPSESSNSKAHIDLSTAQSDPGDHKSVWIAHARAVKLSKPDKQGRTCWYRARTGKVTP